jgi:hypothetical protein
MMPMTRPVSELVEAKQLVATETAPMTAVK